MKVNLGILLFIGFYNAISCVKYEPNWDSLDSRPLPNWYDESKIGIFIHWGVFSVPSFGSEWFWWYLRGEKRPEFVEFMRQNYKPNFSYQEFAPQFTAEFFEPDKWADLFKKSGAKYVVLTSKHHEGFTLWPSKFSWNWNAMDIGPKKDLVGDLAQSVRNSGLKFGLYHSLFEWFNPIYLSDKKNNFKTQIFVHSKTLPEIYEIINKYKPDVLWSDGDGETTSPYWNSTNFLTWLYNESPVKDTIVTNDRWGTDTNCKHGGFLTCADRFVPSKLMGRKWENAMTLDKNSWGYRRNSALSDYLTIDELLNTLIKTISLGGNILINVGPTHEGLIDPIMQERLVQLGTWLNINGEGIYSSVPWENQNDTITADISYTSKSNSVYCFFNLKEINENNLKLGSVKFENMNITLLGQSDLLKWSYDSKNNLNILLPNSLNSQFNYYTLKITELK